jgi:hypothetical protein
MSSDTRRWKKKKKKGFKTRLMLGLIIKNNTKANKSNLSN